MKRNISIQLKAAFLLLVFAFNTAVGFACAIGVDMGFNAHHHDEEATEIHVHANGTQHEHHKKTANHHHEENKKEKKEDGGCCNDSVIKFSQTDKSVPQSNSILSPVFFTAFIATHYNIDIFNSSQVTASIKYFARSYHPPIPDIRIAIQSFQI
jgi:hypothetical protein